MEKKSKEKKIPIKVYLKDEKVYTFSVRNIEKARECARRIVKGGWSTFEGNMVCYYPVHQILKVVFPMIESDALAKE